MDNFFKCFVVQTVTGASVLQRVSHKWFHCAVDYSHAWFCLWMVAFAGSQPFLLKLFFIFNANHFKLNYMSLIVTPSPRLDLQSGFF